MSGISNLFVVSNFLVDGVISWELIGTPWDELDGGSRLYVILYGNWLRCPLIADDENSDAGRGAASGSAVRRVRGTGRGVASKVGYSTSVRGPLWIHVLEGLGR